MGGCQGGWYCCLENKQINKKQDQKKVISWGSSSQASRCCIALSCGVSQGSILGPWLFSLNLLPLDCILRKQGISFQCYADDCQIDVPPSKKDPILFVFNSWNGLSPPSPSEMLKWVEMYKMSFMVRRCAKLLQHRTDDCRGLLTRCRNFLPSVTVAVSGSFQEKAIG